MNNRIFLAQGILASLIALSGCGGGGGSSDSSPGGGGVPTLISIIVTSPASTIAKGTRTPFTATGIYSNSTSTDLTFSATWTSSLPLVSTISVTGLAEAVGKGAAAIVAVYAGKTATALLTVTDAELVSFSITPTSTSIAKGLTQQFTAMGTFSDATVQDITLSAAWSSSNPLVSTINSVGLASSSIMQGTTTITAVQSGLIETALLSVTAPELLELSITPSSTTIASGQTQQFTVMGIYTDSSTEVLTPSAMWTSSNPGCATIDSTGLASAALLGTATISAVYSRLIGTALLTVTPAALVSLAVTPVNPNITIGATQQFTATGTLSDNSIQDLTALVTWSSTNVAAATISNAAGSNGLATAVAAGLTTITATSGSVSGTSALTVTGSSTVTLAWDAPTTRVDGSSLDPATEITTYKLYYGTASQMYTQIVNVANPGTATITQTLTLAPGTYYFAVTDIDNNGVESGYTNEISRTF